MQTREQMIAERNASERAKAIAQRATIKPTAAAYREANGVRIVIRNPTANMRATMDTHGFALAVDLANTYERTCSTPDDLTVIQTAIKPFFASPQ